MTALRVMRKVVDWLIILGITLFVIFRFGILGNVHLPTLDSPIAEWGEIPRCLLWLIVPLYVILLAFKTRRWAGYACFLGVLVAAYFPPSISFLQDMNVDPFLSYILAGIFVALGLYWLLTSAFGCPPVITPLTHPSRVRSWAFISGGVLACGLGL